MAISSSCEDFPCCGHEMGDCNGKKYGSDASIKARARRRGAYYDGYDEGSWVPDRDFDY
jgi:hypothetical protein